MKELSVFMSKDKLPYFEKACKDGLMKIIKIDENSIGIYEIFIEYNPIMLELIFSEIFYAGICYGLDKNKK